MSVREAKENGEEGRKGWQYMIEPKSDASVVLDVVRPLFSTSPCFSLESENVNVDESVLYTYLLAASQKYNDNPYHNLQHAANVSLFVSNMLIECCTGMDPLVCFALLISAFVHDVDHGGRTNTYEINSRSRLAKIYNDQSVLEHHHCSTAFFLLDSPGCDFLSRLSFDRRALFRKAVIGNVLATDMAVHDQIVATCREREGAGGFRFEAAAVEGATSLPDQLLLSRILIHAADLSTPVRSFESCKKWASLIALEFNAQVELEKQQGLPVLGFMHTPTPKSFYKGEIGFSRFVARPMWVALSTLFPSLGHLVQELDSNIDQFAVLLSEAEEAEAAAAAATPA